MWNETVTQGDFTVRIAKHSHWMEFLVYEIEGHMDGLPVYVREGAMGNSNPTSSLDEAEVCLSGVIKWDGCSDWRMPNGYHGCCRDDLVEYGEIMVWCWDKSREMDGCVLPL